MSCIYCHAGFKVSLGDLSTLQRCKCYNCGATYLVNNDKVIAIFIGWLIDGIYCVVRISPENECMDIYFNEDKVCSQKLQWVFPHIVPDFLTRIIGLKAFL